MTLSLRTIPSRPSVSPGEFSEGGDSTGLGPGLGPSSVSSWTRFCADVIVSAANLVLECVPFECLRVCLAILCFSSCAVCSIEPTPSRWFLEDTKQSNFRFRIALLRSFHKKPWLVLYSKGAFSQSAFPCGKISTIVLPNASAHLDCSCVPPVSLASAYIA
ncbi:hypothetical protein V7S43_010092 [Phytophthora oleae]|uniref:Uncharacterized protein n=1 Tax=Phytophthora oleae TaxID=2107226 RepID=A0ABD3FHB5_9STRA